MAQMFQKILPQHSSQIQCPETSMQIKIVDDQIINKYQRDANKAGSKVRYTDANILSPCLE